MTRKCLMILLCMPLAFLVGCFDYRDVEDLSVPVVVAYDAPQKSDYQETEKVVISGAIVNPTPGMPQNRIERIVARTTADARDKTAYYSPGFLVLGQIQVLLHGEDLARQGLDIDDGLLRVAQTKRTLYMAIVEGRADDLLKTKITVAPQIGTYLLDLLRKAQRRAFLPATTMHTFEACALTTGKNPIIPIIRAESNKIGIVGTGIFNKRQLVAKVGIRESRSLVMLRGLRTTGFIPFVLEKQGEQIDEGTVSVTNSRKVKVDQQNGKITFYVNVFLKGSLVEHSDLIPVDKTRINEIEKVVSRVIAADCRRFIRKMQEDFGVDCIDITKFAQAKWRNELEEEIKEGDFIRNVQIVVNVKTKISDVGQTR